MYKRQGHSEDTRKSFGSHSEVILGSFWGYFGDDVGSTLGSLWTVFGVTLDRNSNFCFPYFVSFKAPSVGFCSRLEADIKRRELPIYLPKGPGPPEASGLQACRGRP